MKLFEMEGFLRGKCLPGDMKVNETNAEYLVRKFAEAESKCAALAALAAENAGLKDEISNITFMRDDDFFGSTQRAQEVMGRLVNVKTPATDAFLAEVLAQGVEMFSEKFGGGTLLSNMVKETAKEFAAQLRKGVQS